MVDPLKQDPIITGGGNTQTAVMANNTSMIWPPPAYDGKVRFDVWEAQLDMYIADKGVTDKKVMVRSLLQHIGSEMFEKITDWCAPNKPINMEYDDLLKLIRDKCTKKPNLFALRVRFFNERQQPGQSLDEYFAHMTRLYGQCAMDQMTADDFGALAVLKGLANDDTRQHLMTSSTPIKSIAKIQEMATLFEQGKAAAKEIKGDIGGGSKSSSYSMNIVGKGCKCRYCGGDHQQGKEFCPANGRTCSNCGRKDHFAKVCKSRFEQQNMIEERAESMNGLYSVLTVSSRLEEGNPPIIIDAKLNGCDIEMQHDTGSAVSIISKKIWHAIGKPRIYPSSIQLKSYNKLIPVIGQCKVFAQVGHQIKQQWITVVPKGMSLLGRSWIRAFNVGLQRLCNTPHERELRDRSITVTKARPYIRRAANDFNAMNMHASMQGKEKDVSGKAEMPWSRRAKDKMKWNGRCMANTTRPKLPEGTVRKGFTLQNRKHSKADIEKDWRKSKSKLEVNVKDQADLSCKSRKQDNRDTVASKHRDFVAKDKDPKGFGRALKKTFGRDRRAFKAFTVRDEARSSQAARTKIQR